MPIFRHMRYILTLLVFALLAVGVFLGSFVSAHSDGDNSPGALDYDLDLPRTVSPEAAKYIGLKTAETGRKAVRDVLETSGIVMAMPDRTCIAAPRFPGLIRAITKNIGDVVKPGEIIALIESPELVRNALESRKLEVDRQKLLLEAERTKQEELQFEQSLQYFKTQVDTKQKDYDRLVELKKLGQALPPDFAARETLLLHDKNLLQTKVRENELNHALIEDILKHAEATQVLISTLQATNALDVNAKDANVLELKALFAGHVVSRGGSPGQWVQAGQMLLEITDFSVVQVLADLPESLAMRLRERKSDKVGVALAQNTQWHAEGKLRAVAPVLDSRKRTIQVLVEVPNPDGVLMGEMAVNLGLELGEQKQTLVVPRNAVLSDGPVRYVFVESGGQYQKQDIVPGARDDQYVEIKEGLAPGDIVVVEGAAALALMPGKRKN